MEGVQIFQFCYRLAFLLCVIQITGLSQSAVSKEIYPDRNTTDASHRDQCLEIESTTWNDKKFTLVPANLSADESLAEDTPQPTISKETYDRLMPILNLFNLVFDALSIVLTFTSACIYALPNMHCATAHYLVALNAAETVSGLLVVVKRTRDVIWGATTPYTAWFGYLTLIGTLMVSVSCRRTVYCLTAMVSMERFFVITFPLKARYMKLIRYPKVCIGCVAVSALVFHTYLPLKYKVAPSRTGVDYTITVTEVFRDNEQLFDDVANVAKFLFSYIPLGFCLALSLALMAALKRQAASRQSLQESRDEGKARIIRSGERQLAMTIWISTLLFALLSLPSNTAHLISTFHSTFYFNGFEHRLYRLVDTCAQIPLIASRFTNFLSYLGLSTAFRRNLLRIFFCKNVVRGLTVPGKQPNSSRHDHLRTMSSQQSFAGVSVITSTRL
ncbi:hypothetical protein BaRGS_00019619 [Batillaria attramentaria]|uniref:G-protein coupled receptors family 1 profile domain-containing protein n=1 Tax=Batillaria attramentaria TaxID=370345 RepID=A0ABD0KPD3_9CAEN